MRKSCQADLKGFKKIFLLIQYVKTQEKLNIGQTGQNNDRLVKKSDSVTI